MENDFYMWIRICLIANVVPYWNLLICIWCYFIIQWNKWVKYYCICVYKIPLTSYKITWAKGSSTIVIMCCLSSVRDYFNIIDFSETVERNSMKFDRNVSNPLPNLCFWADWKTKNTALASDWPRHFWLLLWNCWTEFNETWQEASSQHPLPSSCFGADWKPRWPPWPLIGRDLFYFFSATTEQNSTKLDGDKISTFLPISCIWGRWENKDGCLGLWFFETSKFETARIASSTNACLASSTKACFKGLCPYDVNLDLNHSSLILTDMQHYQVYIFVFRSHNIETLLLVLITLFPQHILFQTFCCYFAPQKIKFTLCSKQNWYQVIYNIDYSRIQADCKYIHLLCQ